jgi:hypothetical protein
MNPITCFESTGSFQKGIVLPSYIHLYQLLFTKSIIRSLGLGSIGWPLNIEAVFRKKDLNCLVSPLLCVLALLELKS